MYTIHKYQNGRYAPDTRLKAGDYIFYAEERRVYKLVPSTFGAGIGGLKWERADADVEAMILDAVSMTNSVVAGVSRLAGSLATQNAAAIEWHDAMQADLMDTQGDFLAGTGRV